MFSALRQTHIISVVLFLLIYIIKTALLLVNKNEALEKFKKATKVLEMIASVVFLGTGIYLIIQIPEIKNMLIIKLVAVALSIPIAIVGFKKGNKFLATLSLLLIIAAYGLAEMSKKQSVGKGSFSNSEKQNGMTGEQLFLSKCAMCHGADGKAGIAGAADLSKSAVGISDAKKIVESGKGSMTGFQSSLTSDEIDAVAKYCQTLRK